MAREVRALRLEVAEQSGHLEMLGDSEAMRALRAQIAKVAPTRGRVLVTGESGTGKELVARAIHRGSAAGGTGPKGAGGGEFVKVNCAAIPPELIESELFGHERGAFTGAVAAKPGLLESADGGTVFLDEIGDLPPSLQAKLLRAIESRTITRVGAVRSRTVDVRFVAATNRGLQEDVDAGRFRRDLFYRLNTVTLTVPPLRARRSEIEPLARLFLDGASTRFGIPGLTLSPASVAALVAHAWPGNVRELRNIIERAVLLCPQTVIEPAHLGLASAGGAAQPAPVAPEETLGDAVDELGDDGPTRARIERALVEHAGNQSRAAKALGIPRRTLVRQIARLKLPRPRKPAT